ncbi:hypothetical protein HHL17_26900 [Chitinophaga sp. G-6-1-13]|uniref:CHAT domain-containing protein n=1 Tax=Chitinophaga fulva TaxID=2728842 RepID=A0A848GQG1_9BACT|nr:hypothetical protein [Chitinophaga fulva]NML40855.1 hypothetical protein [Chitinophaga fulva]
MPIINKIFIIQSLKTIDPLESGKELSSRLSSAIPVDFKDVETDIEVFEHLDNVQAEISETNEKYVIHFVCHGNEDGIGIFDKSDNVSFIAWEDLRERFRDIYLATKQRVMTSFSSCEGLNVVKLIASFKPCPFDSVTGSFEKISFRDSVDGYEHFYNKIYNGETIEAAMEETRRKYPSMGFSAFTTQKLVKIGWDGYLTTQFTPEKVKERKAQIITAVTSLKGSITSREIEIIDKKLSKKEATKDFEHYKKIFFS